MAPKGQEDRQRKEEQGTGEILLGKYPEGGIIVDSS